MTFACRVAETPDFLESVANDPRVFPAVSCVGIDEIRLSPIWDECIGIEFDGGGFVFHHRGDGVYEVHTLFLPEAEHKNEKTRAARELMFDVVGATKLITQVATDLPHVKRFAQKHGFVKTGEVPGGWVRASGPVDVELFEMTRDAYERARECQ